MRVTSLRHLLDKQLVEIVFAVAKFSESLVVLAKNAFDPELSQQIWELVHELGRQQRNLEQLVQARRIEANEAGNSLATGLSVGGLDAVKLESAAMIKDISIVRATRRKLDYLFVASEAAKSIAVHVEDYEIAHALGELIEYVCEVTANLACHTRHELLANAETRSSPRLSVFYPETDVPGPPR